MLNLSVVLEDSARRYPNKDAFIFMDTHLSFAQVNAAANQVANGLRSLGIQPGDKVALSCLNLPYFPIVYYGILKAGAVVVPLSVLLKRREITYHLQDSDARAYLCFEGTPQLPMGEEGYAGFREAPSCDHFFLITGKPDSPSPIEGVKTLGMLMAGQPPAFLTEMTGADDTAVIIYTSGTTGKPKGAELTHSNLMLNAVLSADLVRTRKEDVQLIVLPLFHIFAMTVLLNAGAYRGATSVLLPRFDAENVLGLMQKHGVTVFAGVPTMYWGLLNYHGGTALIEAARSKLKVCVSGGASLPVEVLKGFEAKYQVPIIEGYGMSEGSPVVTFNHQDQERKPGSIGTPVWGVEVMIADENDKPVPSGEKGQLLYRGHNVMKGYYKRPEANAESLKGGWMHSGDVAIMDEDGYYYIVDRTKDMIIRGGLNVYPREVEEVLMEHEAISLVAVIGVPDKECGEEVKAFIVLNKGAQATEDGIIGWAKERMAAYKYPRMVEFVEELPMSATGKILKKELRKRRRKI
ncbi:MAG: long-chain fatty acid--CoA ligase [Lewinellaceae bacterium]|nr:long-chain fatty acid--CoA ligase [Lewinellaceae bacterium]MCB9287969.1 long-chain fatty acid--CoA ligase [Lewinellaceae bacterium]